MTTPGGVLAVLLALVAVPGCDYLPFGYTPVKEIVGRGNQASVMETAARGSAG